LASEHGKGNEEALKTDELIPEPNTQFQNINSSAYGTKEATKNWYDWDDSDLQAETYAFSPAVDTTNLPTPLQWKVNQTNNSNQILQPEIVIGSKTTTNVTQVPQSNSLMNWAVFDEQIKALSRNSTSENFIQPNYDTNDNIDVKSDSSPIRTGASPHIQV